MAHIAILVTTISFAVGIAAAVLVLAFYLIGKSELAKSYVILQALIAFCCLLNSSYRYIESELRGSAPLLLGWYLVDYPWGALFFYYYIKFFCNLTGTHYSVRSRKGLAAVAVAACASGALPLFLRSDLEGRVALFDLQSACFLVPLGMAAIVVATCIEIARYRSRLTSPAVRRILRIDFAFKAALVPVLVLAYVVEGMDAELQDSWMYAVRNAYFLAWNVSSVVLALAGARDAFPTLFKERDPSAIAADFRGAMAEASRAVASMERECMDREANESDLARIEAEMRRRKAYLDPEMDLPAFAERVGLARNRVSWIINALLGKNFRDYVNEFRIAEVKRLLAEGSVGLGMLDIAFEAGFNSKATFNAAFKKATGITPTEYASRSSGRRADVKALGVPGPA